MASANMELIHSIYAAWERGDFSRTDWASPEIQYGTADGPNPGTVIGLARMAQATGEWMRVWEGWRVEAVQYLEVDHDRVVVLVDYGGRGRKSGLDTAQIRTEGLTLFEVRGGKVTRLVFYLDRDRGLADVGLAGRAQDPGE